MKTTTNPCTDTNTLHPATWIVQTSAARNKSSWTWKHPRTNVAVLEVDRGVSAVSMISLRARGVRDIPYFAGCLYVGSTPRCAFDRALREAEDLADELESAAQRECIGTALADQCDPGA